MATSILTPVSANAVRSFIALQDAKGDVWLIDMPNAAGAAFVATAIQNELTAAKRGT